MTHARARNDTGPRVAGPAGSRAEGCPGQPGVRGYRRSWLRGDLLAGVTVAAYLVPQVMAYARVARHPSS